MRQRVVLFSERAKCLKVLILFQPIIQLVVYPCLLLFLISLLLPAFLFVYLFILPFHCLLTWMLGSWSPGKKWWKANQPEEMLHGKTFELIFHLKHVFYLWISVIFSSTMDNQKPIHDLLWSYKNLENICWFPKTEMCICSLPVGPWMP